MGRKSDLPAIQRFVEELSVFGVYHPINMNRLYRYHELRNFPDMLSEIKYLLAVPCRLVLGTVRAGGPEKAGAWISRPATMPLYGTSELTHVTATLYVRREFLRFRRFEDVVHAFAHECCHLILDSTYHDLRKEERAVDLLVMMRGFSEITLSMSGGITRGNLWKLLRGWSALAKLEHEAPVGYLTTTEVEYAHGLILKMRKKKK